MVTIVNYRTHRDSTGKEFFSLILEGEVEFVQSPSTGRSYARPKRAVVPAKLEESQCQSLVGKTLEGSIQKIPCAPYFIQDSKTGEVREISFRNVFIPEPED